MAGLSIEEQLAINKEKLIKEILNSDLHGKRVYLLGTSDFGPVNEPIKLRSTIGVHHNFGTRGSLVDGFHEVKYVNDDADVYLVKVTGEHSIHNYAVDTEAGIVQEGFTLCSSQANELFDAVKIDIDIDGLTISFPYELRKPKKQYLFEKYDTIEKLAEAINQDTREKNSFVYAYFSVEPWTPTEYSLFPVNETVSYLSGGDCGLGYSKDMLYTCLERTYEMLESEDIDIIAPLDAFLDDIYPNDSAEQEWQYNMKYYHSTKDYLTEDADGNPRSFLDQIIEFCLHQLQFGVVTTGVIGFNSSYRVWSRFLSESDDIAKMYEACLEYNLNACVNPFYSFLTSVVGGDINYNFGSITDNGVCAFAGMLAKSKLIATLTNVPIENCSIWHEFTEEVLVKLADLGITTFRHSPLYLKPVVYDAVTPTTVRSYQIQCNVRMIQLAISYLNKLYQFYIGMDMVKLIEEGTIATDTDTILTAVMDKGIITEYEFYLDPVYTENHVYVHLALKTIYMTEAVNLCTTVNIEHEEGEE